MPAWLAPAIAAAGGVFGSLLGKPKQSAVNFGDLTNLINTFSPTLSGLQNVNPFLSQAFGRLGQNTYMTPEQFSTLFRQLSNPLQEQYGQQSRALSQNFANRGMLFGGSLTGAQNRLGGNFLSALGGLSGQLGQMDLQLGAQRQGQAESAINSLLQQIMSGAFQLPGYARRG